MLYVGELGVGGGAAKPEEEEDVLAGLLVGVDAPSSSDEEDSSSHESATAGFFVLEGAFDVVESRVSLDMAAAAVGLDLLDMLVDLPKAFSSAFVEV